MINDDGVCNLMNRNWINAHYVSEDYEKGS